MNKQDRIRWAIQQSGKRKSQVARECKVSPAAVTQWISGDVEKIKAENLWLLETSTGISAKWLETGKGEKYATAITDPGYTLRDVPLISWVQAGSWCEAEDPMPAGIGIKQIPCPKECSGRTFALQVRGASMEPRFYEGDIIIIDPEAPADSGKFVIAKKTGSQEATFKQLIREGQTAYLKAINPQWPEPIIRVDEEWQICGVVIYKLVEF